MTPLLVVIAALYAAQAAAQPEEISIWGVEVDPVPSQPGKYELRASKFAIGDPVHETITLHALINGGLAKPGARRQDVSVAQYMRGVFWNDDPCALLFSKNVVDTLEPSYGVDWYLQFTQAKTAESQQKDFADIKCRLLGRSHFGDLQFLHGMAAREGEKAAVTLEKMMAWANITYRIATGGLAADALLESDPVAKTLGLNIGNMAASELFVALNNPATRARALGSLLHMVQDSFAGGHVSRVAAGHDAGKIDQFLCYVGQSTSKHKHDDAWGTSRGSDLQRTMAVRGAPEALAASTEVVRLFRTGATWDQVEKYLRSGPFRMVDNPKDADPGGYG